ncbi:MAG: DUF4149 domain-containing protein [Burkholderiales bacterium]|nr:DUF4149 domain-containing protein [Burkholderiales bacterium]
MNIVRIQSWLCGLWAGLLLAIGGVVAPALFMALDRASAGRGAGQVFQVESRVSLALAVLIFLLERRRVRDRIDEGVAESALSATILIVLGALFLTILGGFVLQPMIQAAKAGQATALSFSALHGLSAGLYWVKAVLVLALAWRLTAR